MARYTYVVRTADLSGMLKSQDSQPMSLGEAHEMLDKLRLKRKRGDDEVHALMRMEVH
jgi:hypothetical protein